MAVDRQASILPPAQPSYIFRGHAAQIHSVQIVHRNRRLLTGDADGWIVLWKLESKRPLAVWKAHEGAILGTAEWGVDKVITHGRDNSLRIWQVRIGPDSNFSAVLPAEGSDTHRPKPWLLHTLPVNTLNFCAFSVCHKQSAGNIPRSHNTVSAKGSTFSTRLSDAILVAVPARDDKKIEIYEFPDEKLVYVVPRVEPTDTGMVMAVKLAHHPPSKNLIIVAGYEGGFTAVHLLMHDIRGGKLGSQSPILQRPRLVYLSKPHTQPVLSLDVSPDAQTYYTSAADATIAKHSIPVLPHNVNVTDAYSDMNSTEPSTVTDFGNGLNTGSVPERVASLSKDHEGLQPIPNEQQSSQQTPQHVEQLSNPADQPTREQIVGPATTPKSIDDDQEPLTFTKRAVPSHPRNVSSHEASHSGLPAFLSSTRTDPSALSSLLSSAASETTIKPEVPIVPNVTVQHAYKTAQTKHAGQQGLHVRSDGRLLVTGGWDSRIRIYSTKTLKELAVLKWHKEGVYAADFGTVLDQDNESDTDIIDNNDDAGAHVGDSLLKAQNSISGLTKLQQQRERQMQMKHWVIAGAKDGKVSLWEVF